MIVGLLGYSASAAKTVNVESNFVSVLEIRDGGPEGTLMEVPVSPTTLTFESDKIYIALTDPEKYIESVRYNEYSTGYVANNTCTISTSAVQEGTTLTVKVGFPRVVTVNVPDPELLTLTHGSTEQTLTAGANPVTLGRYDGITLTVKDPEAYKLTRVWKVSNDLSFDISNYRSCSISSYDLSDGDEISYTILPASEFQAPTFNMTLDDPSKLKVSVDYSSIDLNTFTANEPKAIEMSKSTSYVVIQPINSETEIYSCKLNGVEQTDNYGSYYISNVKPDDELVVMVNCPDETYNVTIASDPAENIAYVTGVSVNGQAIANWQDGFTVDAGTRITLSFNNSLYTFKAIEVNGSPLNMSYVYSTAEIKITGNSDIVVKSEKIPTYKTTLVVDDPASVTVKLGYYETLTIQAGENVIEYTNSYLSIAITKNKGYSLNKITTSIDGEVVNVWESTASTPLTTVYVYPEDGMVITVDATPIVYDSRFMIYSDLASNDASFGYITFQSDVETGAISFNEGYTEVKFAQAMNPFSLSWYNSTHSAYKNVYLNEEKLDGGYYDDYSMTLTDGDVVKLYFNQNPETYTATFSIEDECTIEGTKDLITEITDFTSGVSGLNGTILKIKSADAEKKIEVYVAEAEVAENEGEGNEGGSTKPAGAQVTAGEDGYYEIVLDGSKAVTVRQASTDGIESLRANVASTSRDVYTLTGIKVLSNASDNQIKALPAGIYIVGGKKVAIR